MIHISKYGQLLLLALIVCSACNPDTPEPAKPSTGCNAGYVSDIKPIVTSKCAIAGCHDGSTSLPDFRTYAPLKERVDNGKVRKYIFDLKIMPPGGSVQLTEGEKELVKCWLDNGAAEN